MDFFLGREVVEKLTGEREEREKSVPVIGRKGRNFFVVKDARPFPQGVGGVWKFCCTRPPSPHRRPPS